MEQFRNGFLVQSRYFRRYDMANSPFHKHILNTEERRSQLFPDKRKVPGRKAKCLIAVALVLQIWGAKKVVEIRQFWKRRDQDVKKSQRKSTPFFQAMSDLRYCSLEERNQKFIRELFIHKGEDYVNSITQRYNQKDVWAPYYPRHPFMNGGLIRNVKPYNELWYSRYQHGYDVYNI